MNNTLVTTFTNVAAKLTTIFGRIVVISRTGDSVYAIIDASVIPVGDFGERMEPRYTGTFNKSVGLIVGDTLTDGAQTWIVGQLLEDDEFIVKFYLRKT
jgi:hypothetical protein